MPAQHFYPYSCSDIPRYPNGSLNRNPGPAARLEVSWLPPLHGLYAVRLFSTSIDNFFVFAAQNTYEESLSQRVNLLLT